jgi:glutamate--cysteine ligase
MARDTANATPLTSRAQLIEELESGCKPKDDWRVGTEHEKFCFYKDDFSPVPYEAEDGKGSIRRLLEAMQEATGWEPILDEGRIIGLAGGPGEGAISLEPGGQFELSGAPLATIHETCRESNTHLEQVQRIADPMGIGFLGLGGSPKWTFDETPQMPKSRYDIMRRHMPRVGNQGLDMMHRTCCIQANLDFASEEDMRRKMQTSTKLQAVTTALFANSPFTNGKPNGLLSWRSDIWRDTDNTRAGLQPFIFEDGFGFESYVDWALDVPMYFVTRDGHYYDCTSVTFRQFMDGAMEGTVPDATANEGDWTNHLSTLFPDVRLKKFLEMRLADSGPWRRICALPAFWVGLLYDEQALSDAEELVRGWDFEATHALREAVPTEGFKANAGGRPLLDVARDAMAIAEKGLAARAKTNAQGSDERPFLAPLQEAITLGETQAERLLKQYHTNWAGEIDHIFEEYAF